MECEIPEEIKTKIIEKIQGMAYIRFLNKQKINITIPEFKFIISSVKMKGNSKFRIKKNQWFYLAKELEKEGLIKLHGFNPIEIKIKK